MGINKGKRWAVRAAFTPIRRSMWSLLGGCRSLTSDWIDENGALLGRLVKLPHAAFESVVLSRKSFRKKLIFYLPLRQSQLLSVRRWQNLESDGGELQSNSPCGVMELECVLNAWREAQKTTAALIFWGMTHMRAGNQTFILTKGRSELISESLCNRLIPVVCEALQYLSVITRTLTDGTLESQRSWFITQRRAARPYIWVERLIFTYCPRRDLIKSARVRRRRLVKDAAGRSVDGPHPPGPVQLYSGEPHPQRATGSTTRFHLLQR